jgi:hypothetical protein
MDVILQIWGGVGFLVNKILMTISEKQKVKGNFYEYVNFQKYSWIVYLASLPPWIILFALNQNWIASALELAGAPAMLLGLINFTVHKKSGSNIIRFLEILSIFCFIAGILYSLYDLRGITRFTQILEIILTVSYLIGTYLLAKTNSSGYICYIFMHISCGWIMYLQGYYWLFLQQFLSLIFVTYSYCVSQKNLKI